MYKPAKNRNVSLDVAMIFLYRLDADTTFYCDYCHTYPDKNKESFY